MSHRTGKVSLIAVTGGIGAGKSTVARGLGRRGARIVDADQTARRVVDPSMPRGREVLAEIVRLLGPDAVLADGTLNRGGVAALIFDDPLLRERYNAIIHPAIMAETAEEIRRAQEGGGLIVHEIPLLTADTPELPWEYDLIITVEADAEVRLRRLREHRGYTTEHAAARVSAQGDEQRRTAIADIVLRTDGSLEETERRIDELWKQLQD